MVKIAYIELDTHAEIAGNFMELMQNSKNFEVDYYFSEKIAKRLNVIESENIFIVTPENLLSVITKNEKPITANQQPTTHYQLIIIGTVHRYFNTFLKISQQFNTAIIGHNLNFISAKNSTLVKNIFKEDFQYRLKLLLKEGLFLKNKVYHNSKLLVLEHFDFAQCDKNLEHFQCDKNTVHFPLLFSKKTDNQQTTTENHFNIVIPGAVSQKRRDYKNVLNSIQHFKFPLQLVVLGKADGEELLMIKNFIQNKPKNIEIIFFKERVSAEVFEEWMQKADVLWCPIQRETEFFSIKEIYGETKMSGNIGDAIKYKKTAVFPKSYSEKYDFVIPEMLFLEKGKDIAMYQSDFTKDFEFEKVLANLEKTIFALL